MLRLRSLTGAEGEAEVSADDGQRDQAGEIALGRSQQAKVVQSRNSRDEDTG